MATGFAPYLLNDLKSVAGLATPHLKVDMHGFTKFLYQGAGSRPVQTSTLAGHRKEVRFYYRQRNTKAQTDTSASCDNVLTPARLEATVSVNNTRQIAWHLSHDLLRDKYDMPFTKIGVILGNRDHTTMIHHVKMKINKEHFWQPGHIIWKRYEYVMDNVK